MRLAVTIDTEADSQWDYGVPADDAQCRLLGAVSGAVRTARRHTHVPGGDRDRRGRAAPASCCTAWSRRGAAEIGAHLHPWTTPPFADAPGLRYNDARRTPSPRSSPTICCARRSTCSPTSSAAAFGSRPTSYRAGRFGLDERGAALLAEAGYLVDSSVTPLWSWRRTAGLGGAGGPDFRAHSPLPFRIAGPGRHSLIELPVTILATYQPLRSAARAARALPVAAGARGAQAVPLALAAAAASVALARPSLHAPTTSAAVWRCARRSGLEAAVMMFHSSELMPGGSPFRPDAQSVRELLACLDAFFAFVGPHGGGFSAPHRAGGEALAAGARLEIEAAVKDPAPGRQPRQRRPRAAAGAARHEPARGLGAARLGDGRRALLAPPARAGRDRHRPHATVAASTPCRRPRCGQSLRTWRPDVVHSWSWMSALAAGPLPAALLGIPFVDGMIQTGGREPDFRLLKRAGHGAAPRWSWPTRKPVSTPGAVDPAKGRVVYNGFDPSRLPAPAGGATAGGRTVHRRS